MYIHRWISTTTAGATAVAASASRVRESASYSRVRKVEADSPRCRYPRAPEWTRSVHDSPSWHQYLVRALYL